MHPRLTLCQSGHVNRWSITAGHWANVQDDKKTATDLGDTLLVNILAVRDKAIRLSEMYSFDGIAECSYFPESKLFQTIEADKQLRGSKCFVGKEILVWIHDSGFATYFAGAQTAAKVLESFLAGQDFRRGDQSRVVRMTTERMKNAQMSWFVPKLKFTNLTWDESDRYKDEINEFNRATDITISLPRTTKQTVDRIVRMMTQELERLRHSGAKHHIVIAARTELNARLHTAFQVSGTLTGRMDAKSNRSGRLSREIELHIGMADDGDYGADFGFDPQWD